MNPLYQRIDIHQGVEEKELTSKELTAGPYISTNYKHMNRVLASSAKPNAH